MNRQRIVVAPIASSALLSGAAAAADFPNKPIRFIIPFSPGGGTDIIGRFAQFIRAELDNWGAWLELPGCSRANNRHCRSHTAK
ncbi:MAG: hypothetical protein ABI547_01195 [Betaproteobacteria bacterium]